MSSHSQAVHSEQQQGAHTINNNNNNNTDGLCDLLLWKNPVETGKIFFGTLIALLILKKVNLITFFLRLFYTIFLTTGTIELISKTFLGQGLVTKYGIKDCPNTVGIIKPYLDNILKQLPGKQAKMRMLVFAYVPKNTFKAALITFLLHRFFSWFSIWTLLFVGDLALFSLPIIYKTYQREIDTTVKNTYKASKNKANQTSRQLGSKLEPHIKKVGPLNKLYSNYKNRQGVSANSTTAQLASQVPFEKPSSSSSSIKAAVSNAAEKVSSSAEKVSSSAEKLATSATTTGSNPFPNVPSTKPSTTSSSTKEFNLDDLSNVIKENKDTLQNEFEKRTA